MNKHLTISDLLNNKGVTTPVIFAAFFLLVVLALRGCKSPERAVRSGDALDRPLYHWNTRDSLSVRDLLMGGILALGRTSSGKTSSCEVIAKQILEYGNSSMLVMCAKQGEAEEWLKLCKRTGRSKDVVVFGADRPARFNMVGWQADRGGVDATQRIVDFISEMRSVLLGEAESSGGNQQFWRTQDERALTNAVNALRIAGTTITPLAIHDFIMTAPDTLEDKEKASWQNSFCNRVLKAGFYAKKTTIQQHDFGVARDYYTVEWPSLAKETRGSILVGTIGVVSAMNTGLCRELFANETNTNPRDAIENRRIYLVDMPPDEFGKTGKIANAGLKYFWQQEVLRRRITKKSPISVIWGDEATQWISPFDSSYVSRCRSYRGSMVYISQSLHSFYERLPGDKGKSSVEALLSNFGHRLVFSLGDMTTAIWAADLCGKELKLYTGGSTQHSSFSPFITNEQQYSTSFNEQLAHRIEPGRFLHGFRTGGPLNNFMVDALLLRSGEAFSNGLPIIQVSFKQEV